MSPRVPPTSARRRRRHRAVVGAVTGVATAVAAAGIALAASPGDVSNPPPGYPRGSLEFTGGGTAGSAIQIGASGFAVLPSPASRWVDANPGDPRTPVLRDRIASQPAALWLTGAESYGNLDYAVAVANRNDSTLTLTLYDIPGRNDGLSGPTDVTPAQYRAFIDRVVSMIGSTRAVIVVEPDALWFVDRQTPPGSQQYTDRMALLNYVVDSFRARAPRAYLYLEAGTSSRSVTPERMAQLLKTAGVAKAAGFAVNVSSFGPDAAITQWAQGIRAGLGSLGVGDVHYVVDTSRNGNPTWDNTWCNPPSRKIGYTPGVTSGANGLDANLWVKTPGTSDGNCGVGPGTYGGQFMPQVAYDLVT